jgi:kumamolisin
MATTQAKLAGTDNPPHPCAHAVGPADPNQVMTVTVMVRSRNEEGAKAAVKEMSALPVSKRRRMSHQEFTASYGADPADMKRVEDFGRAHGLQVVESSVAKKTVILKGTVAACSKAFGVKLEKYAHPRGAYRGRSSAIYLPSDLAPVVEAVLGLGNRRVADPHIRLRAAGAAEPAAAGAHPFNPGEVARLYNFPTGLDGSNQCIALIELGGNIGRDDLDTYFSNQGIDTPKVVQVDLPLAPDDTDPHLDTDADGEVMLDIEVAGAVAPKAKIVVYFAPNTDEGFTQAISAAINDTDNRPSIISISWGGPEQFASSQQRRAMDLVLRDAMMKHVTVCTAAGDNGSTDLAQRVIAQDPSLDDGSSRVDFPSSSTFALSCGGTHLLGEGLAIDSETVWNVNRFAATGGGVSEFFGKPDFQANANVPVSVNSGFAGRGVPDVSGDADRATGYNVRFDGQDDFVGGTSAVAPLWAGLIALINQSLDRSVGFINPQLYAAPSTAQAFRDITVGNNGAFQARAGWDGCTGLGTPNGQKILEVLQ